MHGSEDAMIGPPSRTRWGRHNVSAIQTWGWRRPPGTSTKQHLISWGAIVIHVRHPTCSCVQASSRLT